MIDKEYRKLKKESYSSVKQFDSDRIKYYQKYILGQYVEDEMSTAMKLGSAVDCKIFAKDEWDDRFVVATCNLPGGQLGEFTEKLCTLTTASLDSELKVTREIDEMMLEAFNTIKFDKSGKEVKFKGKTFEWVVSQFVGSDAESYYKICRSQFGKIVLDMNLVNAAEKTIEELETCDWTKDIILAKSGGDLEVIDQLGITYEVNDMPFKGMPDRVIINHGDKEYKLGLMTLAPKSITPFDLKISWSGEEFQYNYYKMKYYLQIASYYLALRSYATVDRPELMDYTIPSIEFIVGSSNLNSNPLLYSTNMVNVSEGLLGFELNGRKCKGLFELVAEIQWHKKNQLWRNSKEVYDNNGRMAIKPFVNEI